MTPLDPTFGPLFRPHDRLTGADLTDWQRVPLFASARHFRALHRLYGVAEGLSAGFDGTNVYMEKGVAFDAYGRPLWLVEPTSIQASAGDWIVLSGDKPKTQQLGVVVPAPQGCRIEVRKECNGKPPKIQPWEVPLAKLPPPGEMLELDFSVRPIAVRAFRRPYLATGTVASGTSAIMLKDARGWQVWVDTSAAGFLTSRDVAPAKGTSHDLPVYVASIGKQTAEDAWRLQTGQQLLGGSPVTPHPPFVSVSQASHRGFLLTVDYGRDVPDLHGASATPLEVRWLGVEQRSTRDNLLRNAVGPTEGFIMPNAIGPGPLPWPEFCDDARLLAPDLNDLQQTVRKLQWIHNRTLHVWGVAAGCAVTALPDRRAVLVQPGYALDIQGHEVIVTDPIQLLLPAQKISSGPDSKKIWWVTVSYRDVQAPRDGNSTCRQQGTPLRRLPQAVLRWRDPEDNETNSRLEPGLDVILASVEVERGEVAAVTSVGRRSATPSKRPHIYAGRIALNQKNQILPVDSEASGAGSTGDQDWSRFVIDTSAAKFVATPHYVFTVEWDAQRDPIVVTSQPYVQDPKPTQFTLAMPPELFQTSDAAEPSLKQTWLWIALAFLIAAVLFQLLQGSHTGWAWSLSGLSAAMAALPSCLSLLHQWIEPAALAQVANKSAQAPPWETVLKNKLTSIFVASDLFGDYADHQGSSRWWLLGTVGLPASAVLAHLPQLQIPETWIWSVSGACALAAALLNAWLAWRQSVPPVRQANATSDIKITIAWIGIEV